MKTTNVDPEDITKEVNDANFKEELRSCHYFLVDSELDKERHNVFNYAKDNLNATIVEEKLHHFFNNFLCATKMNLATGLLLKNIADVRLRHFPLTHTKVISCCVDRRLCTQRTT